MTTTTLMPGALDTANLIDPTNVYLNATTPTHSVLHSVVSDAVLAVEKILVGSPVYNVVAYGATGQTGQAFDATTTSGNGTIGSASAGFHGYAGDVSGLNDTLKHVTVYNPATGLQVASGTIGTVNSATSISLTSGTASATITGGIIQWWTDDSAAFAAAITDACAATNGGIVYIPRGSYTLSTASSYLLTASNVDVQGAGMGKTLIRLAAGTTIPAAGLLGCTDSYGQSSNSFYDFTLDLNGYCGTQITAVSTAIAPASWSTVTRVEVFGRPRATSGSIAWDIFLGGHDQTCVDCHCHDDAYYQTTSTTSLATGTPTITPGSMAGTLAKDFFVIDPSVNAYGIIGGSGVRTVTPHDSTHDSLWPNPVCSSGMLGIVNGQVLTVDIGSVLSVTKNTGGAGYTNATNGAVTFTAPTGTAGTQVVATGVATTSGGALVSVTVTNAAGSAAMNSSYTAPPTMTLPTITFGTPTTAATWTVNMASLQENVAVTATTRSTFTANFLQTHSGNVPIVYSSINTELSQITSVSSTTLVAPVQIAHASGVALIFFPTVDAAVAIGCIDGNYPTRQNHSDVVRNCRFERLGHLAVSSSNGNELLFAGCHVYQCVAGLTTTNGSHLVIERNIVDLTWFGLPPAYATAGVVNSCYFWTVTQPGPYINHVVTGNVFRGGMCGTAIICNVGTAFLLSNMAITGNVSELHYLNAIWCSGGKNVTISGNSITNPCGGSAIYSTQPVVGGSIAAIELNGSAVATFAVDAVTVAGNTIIDSRGVHLMPVAVMCAGAFCTNVTCSGNVIENWTATGGPIQAVTSAKVQAFNNVYTPITTLTYAGTLSVPCVMDQYEITTTSVVGNATLNAAYVGPVGQRLVLTINNDATAARTITFGTSFRSVGTIVGTASKAASITFESDGVSWFERGRALVL